MKRSLSILAVALLVGTGAQAQTFEGPYAGAEIGRAFGDADFRIREEGLGRDSDAFRYRGFEGGAFAGFRRELAGGFVLGGEVAGRFGGADGSRSRVFGDFFGDFDLGLEVDKRRELALSARPGFVVRPDTMVYAIAGVQRARFRVGQTFAGESRTDNVSRNGYHLGAGVEHAPRADVSIRAELLYQRYNRIDFLEPNERLTFEPDETALRVGVLYRF